MGMATFGEIANFINGRAFKPEEWGTKGLPIIRIQNLTGSSQITNYYDGEFDQKYLVKKGDLLISWSASLGVYLWSENDAILNQHIFKVDPSRKVDKTYFYYAAFNALNEMASLVHGSTMKHITKEPFEATRILLPSLPEQKHIAAILGKVDRLRQLRRYALELSSTYLQSVFLEMFGDPVTNPKGWDLKTLGDVIYSAQDGPHVSPDYSETGIPFLSTRNIRQGQVIWEDLKFISREEAEKHWQKCKPQRGDILYTKGGTTGLAKAIDFDREIAVWVHIALVKPNNMLVDSLWLESMLNSDFCYNQSQEFTHGIANHDLGLTRMVKIQLYLPPLTLQKEFTRIAKKYMRLIAQQKEAERQAEHLFQTLLHKAFQGELTPDEVEMQVPVIEEEMQQASSIVSFPKPVDKDAYQLALQLD